MLYLLALSGKSSDFTRMITLLCACLAEMTLVICDQEHRAAYLLDYKEKGLTPKMSCLVLFTSFSQAFAERAKKCGVEVLGLDDLMVSAVEAASHNADSFKF